MNRQCRMSIGKDLWSPVKNEVLKPNFLDDGGISEFLNDFSTSESSKKENVVKTSSGKSSNRKKSNTNGQDKYAKVEKSKPKAKGNTLKPLTKMEDFSNDSPNQSSLSKTETQNHSILRNVVTNRKLYQTVTDGTERNIKKGVDEKKTKKPSNSISRSKISTQQDESNKRVLKLSENMLSISDTTENKIEHQIKIHGDITAITDPLEYSCSNANGFELKLNDENCGKTFHSNVIEQAIPCKSTNASPVDDSEKKHEVENPPGASAFSSVQDHTMEKLDCLSSQLNLLQLSVIKLNVRMEEFERQHAKIPEMFQVILELMEENRILRNAVIMHQ